MGSGAEFRGWMALQAVEADLPLSLDDFIPPHLQKKRRPPHGDTPRQVTPAKNDQTYKASFVFMPEDTEEDTPSPPVQRRWIRYDGIGPTDEVGMPYASRSSVDKPREWYRNMFKVLHQLSESEDSDNEGSRQAADQEQTYNVKETSGYVNKQQEQKDKPRQSQQNSQLHITIKSKVRESPNKLSAISKVQTSPSSILSQSMEPSLSLDKPTEVQQSLAITCEGPVLTRNFINAHSLTISSTKPPLQTEVNISQRYQQIPEPASSYSQSSRIPYTSRALDYSDVAPRLAPKQISSPQSPNGKEKHPLFIDNSSGMYNPSPSRRSTTKILDQLETELRQFTEELDRGLEARKQRTDSLDVCEEVLSRRSSYREDGSPEPTLSGPHSRSNREDYQALPPVAQAVVKFDFAAQSEKELSLQRGTKVYILKKVDQNWLLGEQDGRQGLFPESYVKFGSPSQCDTVGTPQLSAVALYDFKADSDAEMPLRKGQHVLITRRVGGSWFEGRVENSARLGLFPANYVQIKDGPLQKKGDSSIKASKGTKPVVQVSAGLTLKENPCIVKAPVSSKLHQLQGTLYQARFSFSPSNPDELQLQAGDLVTVTEHCDDGWCVGACWRTQQFGTFPGNYVDPYEMT